MVAKRLKIERKVDRKVKTDSIPEKIKQKLEQYSKALTVALVVVALGLTVYYGYGVYSASQEKKAAVAYSRAISGLPGDDASPEQWAAFSSQLEKIVGEYSGTAAALNARLDLSRAAFRAKDYENSIKWAQKVTGESGAVPQLTWLARYQLAMAFEAAGKPAEALVEWEKIKTDGPSAMLRETEWHLARIHLSGKDYAKAVDAYGQALKAAGNYPSTPSIQMEIESAKINSGGNAQKNADESASKK